MTAADCPRVLIGGGGVAAVETLLALRHLAGEQVSVELLAPERAFVHRPSSVGAPFGFGAPAPLDLGELAGRFGAGLQRGAVSVVDAEHRVVVAARPVRRSPTTCSWWPSALCRGRRFPAL